MLWIDTDMGFDDMLAIMMIEKSELEIAGASLVFGIATLDQVCRNAASAAALLNWKFPIHTGAEKSVLGPIVTAEYVLGPTGIPTLGLALSDAPPLPYSSAFNALTKWLEGVDEPADLLALGPLTNIAALALARPDLMSKLKQITWMGGGAGQGNHSASAEFNAFADPEALAIVLASGVPFRMVELDLCREVLISPDDLAELRALGTQKSDLLADLFGGYVDIAVSRGRSAMAMYDPLAAAALVDPDAVTFKPTRIDVELGGNHTRGRTVVEPRDSDGVVTQIGSHVDAERVREIILSTILQAAK